MKILVVEDEPKLAEYLRRALTESNYIVDVAHSGTDGRYLATEGHYDLVLLDVMLPGLDGYAVLQELRRGKHVPVLMLTARDEVEDRVRGLQAGADDYLVKPFALSELLARVQALLRRGALRSDSQDSTVLRLADLELDLVRRKASRSGQRLDLTQGVHVADVAAAPARAGPFPYRARSAGVGHEFRQQYERGRSCGAPVARQDRRRFREEVVAYRARHGIRP